MSTSPFAVNLSEARRYWCWFITLGVLLLVLGFAALGSPVVVTLVSVVVYGVLIGAAGIGEIVTAFGTRTWGGLFLHLLAGVVDLALGAILVFNPFGGAIALTLLIGILFLVGGALRLAFAAGMQYPNWGWGVLSGVITVLLGGLILANWPYDGLLLIGTFIGIELLFRGVSWLMLGIALWTTPKEPNTPKMA